MQFLSFTSIGKKFIEHFLTHVAQLHAENLKWLKVLEDARGHSSIGYPFLVGGASLKPEFIDICNARS